MKTDSELISVALNLWANYIETGCVTLSRNDCIERKEYKKISSLDINQLTLVQRLRYLSTQILITGLK